MTITGIVSALVLLGISLIAIAYPFAKQQRRRQRQNIEEQKHRDELLTSYERVLATIRDLDEDHQTGKLNEETYQRERQYWTEQGILLLQELDPEIETSNLADAQAEAAEQQAPVKSSADDSIEQAIADYRRARA